MNIVRFSIVGTVLALCLGFAAGAEAFDVPANDGFYTQTTPVLTSAQSAQINQILSDEQAAGNTQIAVLVVESADEPVQDAADAVFHAWGIGQHNSGNGILLFVSASDHKMWISVGSGLERPVSPAVAAGVIETDIAPPLREGKYDEGLLAGIDALKKHVAGQYTAARYIAAAQTNSPAPYITCALLLLIIMAGSWLGRSSSSRLGAILGAISGVLLAVAFNWWISIPILLIIGVACDIAFTVSAAHRGKRSGGSGGAVLAAARRVEGERYT